MVLTQTLAWGAAQIETQAQAKPQAPVTKVQLSPLMTQTQAQAQAQIETQAQAKPQAPVTKVQLSPLMTQAQAQAQAQAQTPNARVAVAQATKTQTPATKAQPTEAQQTSPPQPRPEQRQTQAKPQAQAKPQTPAQTTPKTPAEKVAATVEKLRNEADLHSEAGNATALYQTLQKLAVLEEAQGENNEEAIKQILRAQQNILSVENFRFFMENELTGRELQPKEIAFTFDDGPHPTLTLEIAQVLKQYGVPATFFQVGEFVTKRFKVTQELAREGFNLANHTWDHTNLTTLPTETVIQQISSTQEALLKAVGGAPFFDAFFQNVFAATWAEPRTVQAPEFFRSPYGARSRRVVELVNQFQTGQSCGAGLRCKGNHLTHVMWLVDSLDWADKNESNIEKRVFSQLALTGQRGVMLMHDIHPQTLRAIKLIIPRMIKEGYKFVTLYDVLKAHLNAKGLPFPVRIQSHEGLTLLPTNESENLGVGLTAAIRN